MLLIVVGYSATLLGFALIASLSGSLLNATTLSAVSVGYLIFGLVLLRMNDAC